MGRLRRPLVSLALFLGVAVAVDWISEPVRGLWPAALLIVLGWFFIRRTEQEMAPTFTGPERHRPWLQATGWFFVVAGLLGIALSLLPLL
jgi:hypothetical protein